MAFSGYREQLLTIVAIERIFGALFVEKAFCCLSNFEHVYKYIIILKGVTLLIASILSIKHNIKIIDDKGTEV